MAAESKTTDTTAAEAAETDSKSDGDAKAVERDHKAGKGLRSGWSYNPTRDPKYLRTKEAEKRREEIIEAGAGPAGTVNRDYAAKPQHAKKSTE